MTKRPGRKSGPFHFHGSPQKESPPDIGMHGGDRGGKPPETAGFRPLLKDRAPEVSENPEESRFSLPARETLRSPVAIGRHQTPAFGIELQRPEDPVFLQAPQFAPGRHMPEPQAPVER